jgi:hypothetical protein
LKVVESVRENWALTLAMSDSEGAGPKLVHAKILCRGPLT